MESNLFSNYGLAISYIQSLIDVFFLCTLLPPSNSMNQCERFFSVVLLDFFLHRKDLKFYIEISDVSLQFGNFAKLIYFDMESSHSIRKSIWYNITQK